jgi:Cu(I)/Ag(I) efflux system membrane fusion protein
MAFIDFVPRPRALVSALVAAAVVATATLYTGCTDRSAPSPAGATSRYYCPMHPQVAADEPGECPICRMDLADRELEGAPSAAAAETPLSEPGPDKREVLYWYDPMQPGTHFDRPGKSPFMDMDLSPRYADETTAGAVQLSSAAMAAAGVATVPVERKAMHREIRAAGSIEADETRVARVASRVPGRLERLHLDFTGQQVARGAPIYSIYSPELVTAQRELLLALDNLARAQESASPTYLASAESLLQASRDRLRLWGIDAEQVRRLERDRVVETALVVHSPIAGTVLEKLAVAGQYVTEGQDLYLVADLSRVWLQARVYGHELGGVRLGQAATVTLDGAPGRELEGRVRFIDPVVDDATRTARVRIELPNPQGILKPGMFAHADLRVDLGERLVVPRSALLDTGTRQVVYVKTGEASFVGREVRLGERAGDLVEVVEGLSAGEQVVAAASFLVDSQSQLQTGASVQWGGASEAPSP